MKMAGKGIFLRSILALFVALAAFFFSAYPQKNTPPLTPQNFHRWGSITLFNGLPSDTVRSIVQTDDGVLWFGTDTGLARFDGRRIQSISFPEGKAVRINSLAKLSGSEILVATNSGALTISSAGPSEVSGTQDLDVTALSVGTRVLLGTADGNILEIKPAVSGHQTAERLPVEPPRNGGKPIAITALLHTSRGIVVGTSGGGLERLNENSLTHISVEHPGTVNAIAAGANDALWIAGSGESGGNGLFQLIEPSGLKAFGPPAGEVLTAVSDGNGGVWAGTRRYGLFHFRTETDIENFTFENTAGGLRSNTVFSLFVDRDGVVWAGTDRGISRFDPGSPFHQTLSENPNGNFIRAFAVVGDGRIVVGTNRGMFERTGREWKEIDAFRGLPIYSIAENNDGSLLAGTPQGLVDEKHRTLLPGDIRSVFQFRGSLYAAVYGSGLAAVDAPDSPPIFPNPGVTTASVIGDTVYLGTISDGVFAFDGTAVRSIADGRTLSAGVVRKIASDGQGGLLIAGDRGLDHFSNGSVEQLAEGHQVRDVVVKGNDIWTATTDAGVIHRRDDPTFGTLTSSIGPEQGLPSEKVFAMLDAGNELLIGTNRGIAVYRPGTVPPRIFPVRVSSRRLHDISELSSVINLDYPQDSLLIEVAGQSSRTFPEEFQYAFTLTNEKGDVIDRRLSPDSQFAPTGLKPGTYQIEARVFNRALLSSEPFTLAFSIGKAPFPWTATALAILLLFALIALVWAIIERRRISVRNRELAAARLDLANEAERERSRIARDLHDQTLADLRGLMLKSDRVVTEESGFRADIESISTEIRRICEDLSPSVLENVGLIAALEFLISHTVPAYEFDADDVSDETIGLPMNIQLQIYRIAQEVLSNISRHSDASMVKMAVDLPKRGEFKLTIDDDGKPFSPRERSNHAGRGIGGIRSRASIIGARIEWQTLDPGNRFELNLNDPGDSDVPTLETSI